VLAVCGFWRYSGNMTTASHALDYPGKSATTPITGYAEGYYGRLLSWAEREVLIQSAAASRFNFYLYAPKDDEQHRFKWREPYSAQWRSEFRRFANLAKSLKVQLVAGISPGIDFEFEDLEDGADLHALCAKAIQLIEDGATGIAVLFDDIDPDFELRRGSFQSEGTTVATLETSVNIWRAI